MEWQLIATAPKDGTPILLFIPDYFIEEGKFGAATVGYWNSDENCWFLTVAYGWDYELKIYESPSHWLPLPTQGQK